MSEVRVLAIQRDAVSPEAMVFSTLLSALQTGKESAGKCVFKVIQFNNEKALARGDELGLIPGVQVLSAHIGGSLGMPGSRRKKIFTVGRLLLSLPKIIAHSWAFRPDVIYSSQQCWDVRLGVLLSFFLRRPRVIHLHYLPGPWLGREVLWELKRCARVIGVSEFIHRKAIEAGLPSQRVVAIRNVLAADALQVGISPAEARKRLCEELQIPERDILVGMTARLNPVKGQRELVQALAPLLAQSASQPIRLILAGPDNDPTGTYIQEIFQFAQDQGVRDRIYWLGQRSDIPALLYAFDVFAHPSFNEPCGLAVLEALLAGLPTVVWKEGGAAELVLDGRTGFTVETGNVQALGMALKRLCTEPQLREQMRCNTLADRTRLTDTKSAGQRFCEVLADAAKSLAK
jgi:glycosyltransferase involved in cell wall biosynthesis